MNKFILLSTLLLFCLPSWSQNPSENYNRFKQLKEELPTPNSYRTAAGAPGHKYYQQQADYNIELELIESEDKIEGKETITYHNNSPHDLEYLWVQLDQNVRAQDADSKLSRPTSVNPNYPKQSLRYVVRQANYDFDGGFNIMRVEDVAGNPMDYTINKTMMLINLPSPLKSGAQISFNIDWWYNINDRMAIGGRSGYEYFEKDDNKLYTIAQFFPRMAVYDDVNGWQNKQFLGGGEFALPFGNYDVKITVPADHILAATGDLVNEKDIFCSDILNRLKQARQSYDKPVIIVTQEEAIENEAKKTNKTKTWHYKADNVRDFAFATSRKFIWDGMAVKQNDGSTVMAMSLYPKEGNPLWEEYSTKAVAHTLKMYSKYTFDYPYPVAYSIHAAAIGMEYPMICFNFGRPNEDGTYSDRTKYNMLGVIIHEIGHNYFPMIVNSDERQWGWMDEGINTFVEYLTEREFDPNFQHWYGPAANLMPYMKSDKAYMTPIMSEADNIRSFQLGNNAYGKPATALNILREYIMGPELFDYSFATYSNRWKFKHPTPADFFRSMEDASGMDLDWFWRAWFYSTDHVDIAIEDVQKVDVELTDSDNIPNKHYYQMKFENIGGIPMPLMLELTYEDGSKETMKVPAEAWKLTDNYTQVFILDKALVGVEFDPKKVTTDIDPSNNKWPSSTSTSSQFDNYKNKK
ncbi:MAG: M1 family metallopeptidase [Saprospiraceae bacterium]|nr:M1 family metallopeptidase [Saprospiraceae bacterium]